MCPTPAAAICDTIFINFWDVKSNYAEMCPSEYLAAAEGKRRQLLVKLINLLFCVVAQG